MGGRHLTPYSICRFGDNTYQHQEIWELVRALQKARLRVTLRASEEDRGCLMYEAVLSSKTSFASSGQHGNPFLALRAAVNAMSDNNKESTQ